MKKKTFHTEAAYLLGIFALALGTALMKRRASAFPWWWRRPTCCI